MAVEQNGWGLLHLASLNQILWVPGWVLNRGQSTPDMSCSVLCFGSIHPAVPLLGTGD